MSLLAALGPLLLATSSKSTSSSGSSVGFILILVVIGVVGYFFLLRPQQQKARRQRETQSQIGVGDEILTVGGIVGTVLDIDSERVTIITGLDQDGNGAHPTRLVLVRNAVARKIEPTAPAGTTADDAGSASSPEPASRPERRPGYGGVPEKDEEDGGKAMQGGQAQAEEREGTDGGPGEGDEP
ncbi:MAG: preprotein translocase subunit YajC [Acidimicrobiales bacterium]